MAARSAPRSQSFEPLLLVCTALVLWACPAPTDDASAPEPEAAPVVAATIAGGEITTAELDTAIKEDLFEQSTNGGDASQVYELRKQKLDEIINERLLEADAAAREVTVETLVQSVAADSDDVTDGEVLAFYERVKDQLEGVEYETIEPRIRERLEGEKMQAAVVAYRTGLREAGEIEILLEPPRIEVTATGPSQGPENAPVTIIEFSDYQCPFCQRAEPTVKAVLERYPEQVRFVYRHFPLDSIHPDARRAAEAAACADEQDKFWPFHEALFAKTPEMGDERLSEIAEETALDLAAYTACMESGRAQKVVQSDSEDGRTAGVNGTPAFFVNGIPLSGARSVDDFVEIIESELARQG